MKDRARGAIKKRLPKERVEIVGYACWVIGILCLLLILLPYFDIVVRIYLSASGLAIFGIGTGFIGLGVARKSDKRMQAMANLEFYEKIAVVKSYLQKVIQSIDPNDPKAKEAHADRIYYDIKGARQLKEWVKDPEIEEILNNEIQSLLDKVLEGQTYEHLIKRLQQIQKEDC